MRWIDACIFITLFSICSFTLAQTQIQNAHADFIKLDPYGNIYTVKESQLKKYSPQGKILFNFSDKKLGVISSVDVFNPMKIMLFYQDSGIILFLNEQLAPINDPVSIYDAGYFTVSLASYSAANLIHLYDNVNKYIITLDFNMREISKTTIPFNPFNPMKMIELEEKSIAFHDAETGIYLFDSFVTYIKMIPVITSNLIEITSELIYYTNNNELIVYNYKTMNTETQKIPVSNAIQSLVFRNKMIFLLQNETVWIYDLVK